MDDDVAAIILEPHFDAVRDLFAAFVPEPGHRGLVELADTDFRVDVSMHDKERHFAGTRHDGKRILLAPDIVGLPVETVVAILAHEFGHAADFRYPGRWIVPRAGSGKAVWIEDVQVDTKEARRWQALWRDRSADEIEWAADGIAETVTGKRLGYCGPCMLQCLRGGVERPAGLR